jgi:Ca-activated chloride channel family protein
VNLDALHIAHPELVHGLWLWALVVALLIFLERRGTDSLNRLVARSLEDRLVVRPAPWRRGLRLALWALAGFAMAIALMRPQWGERFVATPRVGAEIMIALDVSRSMLADDAKPSRLERAKAEISDLLAYLETDQVGLIAFAGRASILSPMTPDKSFLRLALDGAGPHSVSRGGTRLAEPILRAIASLGEPGPAQRALILITDGEDHDSFALDAAQKAAAAGIKIITVGFGDEAGSPIFVRDPRDGSRTQVRDGEGKPVISRLDGELLREIALATDGAYVPAGMGVLDLASIYEAHIARLTRGQLDARGRSIRGETYQGFVAAALVGLVLGASALVGGRRRVAREGKRIARSGPAPSPVRTTAGRVALVLVCALIGGASVPVAAEDEKGASDPAAAGAPSVTPPAEAAAGEAAVDEDPRARFNRANARLAEGDPELASTLFREARRDAVDDLELRYAANFNLGVAAVAEADAVVASNPSEALVRLHEAADWFREASAMRPDAADPRHNLEVTLRRALILADEIARKSQRDLEGELDQLIEAQRARVGDAAGLLEAIVQAADSASESGIEPAAVEALRPVFDAAATAQRELIADVESVAERAADEKAVIEAKAEDARTPEEALRSASLESVLGALDLAVGRMGQARRQLRIRSAERAYRRGAEALDALKRARDPLRDPVEQIGVLIAEVAGVAQATGLLAGEKVGPDAGTGAASRVPAFLTAESIGAESAAVEARVGELAERFTTAAARAEAGHAGTATSPQAGAADAGAPAISEALREALEGAAPRIRDAHAAMGRATGALATRALEPALVAEGEAATSLRAAQELFFDLRELLTVSHETEARIAALANDEDPNVVAQRAGIAGALAAEQARNRARATRLETLLANEREAEQQALAAPDPAAAADPDAPPPPPDPAALEALAQRFERAASLLDDASRAMDEAEAGFGPGAAAPRRADWPRIGPAAARATARLDALRMLFSTLVEQLQRLARDQVDLADRTGDAVALSATEKSTEPRGPETRARITALDGEQKTLEARAGAIADALVAESEQAAAAPDAGASPDAPGAAPDAKTLRRAADHVATAQLAMQEASETFSDERLPLPSAREAQAVAAEELRKALELLVPPKPEKPEEPPPQEQGPESGEDESDGEEQAPPEPRAGEDEAPSASEDQGGPPGESQDPAQLLQGVRDREAERREANENRARERRRSAPVEKDW